MLNFAGADQRQDDLFASENFFSRGKSALKGLKGVDNVYTQHTPHLAQTLDLLLRGKLKDTSYPYLDGQQLPASLQQQRCVDVASCYQQQLTLPDRPQDIIVFIIGGTTYEEARTVALLNSQATAPQSGPSQSSASPVNNARILLGGTGVLNSQM